MALSKWHSLHSETNISARIWFCCVNERWSIIVNIRKNIQDSRMIKPWTKYATSRKKQRASQATALCVFVSSTSLPRNLWETTRANHPGVSNGFHLWSVIGQFLRLLIGSWWIEVQSKILYHSRRFTLLNSYLLIGLGVVQIRVGFSNFWLDRVFWSNQTFCIVLGVLLF